MYIVVNIESAYSVRHAILFTYHDNISLLFLLYAIYKQSELLFSQIPDSPSKIAKPP